MRESIKGFADATLENAEAEGRREQLAGELAAFRSAVEESQDLRWALADPGLPVHARRSVVTDLLGSRAGADTTALVAFVIDADRATEVVDDLRWLAGRARRRPAAEQRERGDGGGEGDGDSEDESLHAPLGRTAAIERIDGYATSLLEPVAAEGRLSDVEDELFRFARVVEGDEGLNDALTDRAVPSDRRRAVVSDLLSPRASAATVRLASYAARVGPPRDYVAILDWLVARVAAEGDRRVAEVHAAIDLDDDQRRRLADALSRITGHGVDVRVSVDPEVVGGFVATIGETVVDGSVRHRLDVLKDRLVLPEAAITTDTGESR